MPVNIHSTCLLLDIVGAELERGVNLISVHENGDNM